MSSCSICCAADFLAQFLFQLQEFVHARRVVLLLQVIDGAEAFLHESKAGGVGFDGIHFAFQFGGDVVELNAHAAEPFCQFAGLGRMLLHTAERIRSHSQGLAHGELFALEEVLGGGQCLADVFGVAQQGQFLFEFLLLPCLVGGFFELRQLELHVLQIVAVLLGCFGERAEPVGRAFVVGVYGAVPFAEFRPGCHRVERVEDEAFVADEQVLVLRMDVDEERAEFFQLGGSHGRVVDEGAALAGGRHLAAHDTLRGVEVDVVRFEERLHVEALQAERCLDHTFLLSRLDGLGIGTAAQQQFERTEHDAFARTRFARNHRETGLPVDVELFNQCVVGYCEALNHFFNL